MPSGRVPASWNVSLRDGPAGLIWRGAAAYGRAWPPLRHACPVALSSARPPDLARAPRWPRRAHLVPRAGVRAPPSWPRRVSHVFPLMAAQQQVHGICPFRCRRMMGRRVVGVVTESDLLAAQDKAARDTRLDAETPGRWRLRKPPLAALTAGTLLRRHLRADHGLGVQRVALLDLGDPGQRARHEHLVGVLLDERPRRAGADLAPAVPGGQRRSQLQ
jgi:hypothetical protein